MRGTGYSCSGVEGVRRYGCSSQDGHVRLVDYHGSGSVWSRAAVLDFRAGEMGHSWIILGVSGGSRWE